MATALILFVFLAGLLVVSIGPLERWRLDDERPLDDDDLSFPVAGYGSASVSLNCLFAAYSGALLLAGPWSFCGVLVGFVSGLALLNFWINSRLPSSTFQEWLFGLAAFASPVQDRVFWLLVAFCQIGLALSELVLLAHLFSVGLGLSPAMAIVGSLCVALVAYFYCMIGAYKAVFRTDALQFFFILVMGSVLLFLISAERIDSTVLSQFHLGHENLLSGNLPAPFRPPLDFICGLAMGIMPILVGPDAWKRIFIVQQRRGANHSGASLIESRERLSFLPGAWKFMHAVPWKLVLVAALPLAILTPMLLLLSGGHDSGEWQLPFQAVFARGPSGVRLVLILGMLASFMSTFDSSLVSSAHVLLRSRPQVSGSKLSPIQAYRVIVGFTFASIALFFVAIAASGINPYLIGAFLIGPFALAAGVVGGSLARGKKIPEGPPLYALTILALTWLLVFGYHLGSAGRSSQPESLVPLVVGGCTVFFFATIISALFSRKQTADDLGKA